MIHWLGPATPMSDRARAQQLQGVRHRVVPAEPGQEGQGSAGTDNFLNGSNKTGIGIFEAIERDWLAETWRPSGGPRRRTP